MESAVIRAPRKVRNGSAGSRGTRNGMTQTSVTPGGGMANSAQPREAADDRTPPPALPGAVPLVSVHSDDDLVKEGAQAYLAALDEVRVAGDPREQTGAEVLLVLAGRVTESTLTCLRAALTANRNPQVRVVLVAESITESQLLRAVEWGLSSLLLRPEVGYRRIVRAITECRTQSVLPGAAMRALAAHLRRVRTESVAGHGFTERDIEVLRMLADGAGTAEIADRLGYSERTIKNIINSMMVRQSLRNRTHAVSSALRAGLL
ncbi:LuxR C-terminal-related transcriptional regulator [Streptomyces sp. NPDC048282]|uniref:helix-turn-helix transcriptional regulator n=1 Tax=Streptomyces sp. NPDC048282 TaxID=3365528 RepID=UPI00371BD3CD